MSHLPKGQRLRRIYHEATSIFNTPDAGNQVNLGVFALPSTESRCEVSRGINELIGPLLPALSDRCCGPAILRPTDGASWSRGRPMAVGHVNRSQLRRARMQRLTVLRRGLCLNASGPVSAAHHHFPRACDVAPTTQRIMHMQDRDGHEQQPGSRLGGRWAGLGPNSGPACVRICVEKQ